MARASQDREPQPLQLLQLLLLTQEPCRRFAADPLARPLSVAAGASKTAPRSPPPTAPSSSRQAVNSAISGAHACVLLRPVTPRRRPGGHASRPPSATRRRSVPHPARQAKRASLVGMRKAQSQEQPLVALPRRRLRLPAVAATGRRRAASARRGQIVGQRQPIGDRPHHARRAPRWPVRRAAPRATLAGSARRGVPGASSSAPHADRSGTPAPSSARPNAVRLARAPRRPGPGPPAATRPAPRAPARSASSIPRSDASWPGGVGVEGQQHASSTAAAARPPAARSAPSPSTPPRAPRRLVEHQHVGVALDHDRLAGRGDRAAGVVEAVEDLALGETPGRPASSGTWAAGRRASAARRTRARGRGRRPAGTSRARGSGRRRAPAPRARPHPARRR